MKKNKITNKQTTILTIPICIICKRSGHFHHFTYALYLVKEIFFSKIKIEKTYLSCFLYVLIKFTVDNIVYVYIVDYGQRSEKKKPFGKQFSKNHVSNFPLCFFFTIFFFSYQSNIISSLEISHHKSGSCLKSAALQEV